MHCPQFSGCATRLEGGYCSDADRDSFNRLIDSDGHFSPSHFDGVKPCGEGVMQHVERLAEHRFGYDEATELPVPTDLIQLALAMGILLRYVASTSERVMQLPG
jgi:hypothetical protein